MKVKCMVCGHIRKTKSKLGIDQCSNCSTKSFDYGHNVSCYACEKNVMIPEIHHKNGNRKDNRKENRLPLCYNCHKFLHKFRITNSWRRNSVIERTIKNRMAVIRLKELKNLYSFEKDKSKTKHLYTK